jgi:hypothetical protein
VKKSTNHISDQGFAFGILVVLCATGVALLMIATLKLHIATLSDSDESDEEDEEVDECVSECVSECESDGGNGYSMKKSSGGGVSEGVEGVELLLNDAVEEHGVIGVSPSKRGTSHTYIHLYMHTYLHVHSLTYSLTHSLTHSLAIL